MVRSNVSGGDQIGDPLIDIYSLTRCTSAVSTKRVTMPRDVSPSLALGIQQSKASDRMR
jgi:hypothetical protein